MTTSLEEIGERLAALDGRTRELEQLDGHIQGLKDAAKQAEQSVEKAISPNGELAKHRAAIEQLSSQARQTHAELSRPRTEHAALEELRNQLRAAQTEIKQSVDHVGAIGSEPRANPRDSERPDRELVPGSARPHGWRAKTPPPP